MALLGVLPPRNPLTDQHEIWHGWLRSGYHSTHKWHVSRIRGITPTNGWNVKGLCFLVFFIVSLAQLGVKPLDRFWQIITQNACSWVSCIPRGIKIHKVSVSPIFAPKTPKKGHEYAFSSLTLKILKLAYYRNYCTDSNQILHSDRDHQNTLRGWSKQAYNNSKMADGRHLEKIKNGRISATVQPICTKFGTVPHFDPPKGMGIWVSSGIHRQRVR